jgi:DNA-binding transcriptional LysR family regulator
MELRHLRYFVAVAEELSFTRAADRLFVVQPTLSGQIKQLEQELGVSLFDRSHRAVQLTPAGSMLLMDAIRLLDDADRLVHRMRALQHEATESLSVAFTAATAVGRIAAALSAFQVNHPEVGLSIRSADPATLLRDLDARRVDVVVSYTPDEEPPHPHMLLAAEPLAVALAPDHPLVGEAELELRALANDELLVPPPWRAPDMHNYVLWLCRQAGFEPKLTPLDIPLASRVSLVAHGSGVALVVAREDYIPSTGVVIRPLRENPMVYLHAIWRDSGASLARTAFLDILRELFARGPVAS